MRYLLSVFFLLSICIGYYIYAGAETPFLIVYGVLGGIAVLAVYDEMRSWRQSARVAARRLQSDPARRAITIEVEQVNPQRLEPPRD